MNRPPYSTPQEAPAGRLAAWQEERRANTAAGHLRLLRAVWKALTGIHRR